MENTTTAPAHTPTPWAARRYRTSQGGVWIDCEHTNAKGELVAGTIAEVLPTGQGNSTPEANAAFIVRACNNYQPLIDTLELAAIRIENRLAYETPGSSERPDLQWVLDTITATLSSANGNAA